MCWGGGAAGLSCAFKLSPQNLFLKQLQKSAANSQSKNENHMAELGRAQRGGETRAPSGAPINPLWPAAQRHCWEPSDSSVPRLHPRASKSDTGGGA